MTSHISELFFDQMTYHFVDNSKAVILVPFPGHLDQKWLRFLSFSEKVLKSQQIGFLKGTDRMTWNRGFLKFFPIENIKKKIISKFHAVWVRLCTLKPWFTKNPSWSNLCLKVDISLRNVVQMTWFFLWQVPLGMDFIFKEQNFKFAFHSLFIRFPVKPYSLRFEKSGHLDYRFLGSKSANLGF